MELRTFKSGSIRDWEHAPNLTPRGYEIKKDELYVLNGDSLIKAYHLILGQRISALQMIAKLSPTEIAEIEDYLSLTKHINMVLYHILHSLPLATVLQLQEEERVAKEKIRKVSKKNEGMTLKELLNRFHLSDGGTRDELDPPSPPAPEK